MAKRPLGLAKSAQLKKQKQEAKTELKPVSSENVEQEEADLNIDLDESEKDEALAEIYGLFATFDKSSKSNPKMAMGLVHECDSLLRERQKLPARFHLCYGLALLTIAGFQDDAEDVADGETPEAFVDAAIDRIDVGIEEDKNNGALKAAKATAIIAKLDELLRKTKGSKKKSKVVIENEKLIKEARKLVIEADTNDTYRLAEAVESIQQFAVSLEALPKAKPLAADLLGFTKEFWPKLTESQDSRSQKLAWQGLGELHLAEGQNAFAELMGEDDEEDEEDEQEKEGEEEEDDDEEFDVDTAEAKNVRKVLSKAVEYLEKVQSDEKPNLYVQIAEAKISLGNVTKNESKEQSELYAEAVRLLKKAQRLGAGDYHELIESLED